MKVALITANIGNFSDVAEPIEQDVSFDYYHYTEKNLPYPFTEIKSNHRLLAKYFKTQIHKVIPEYDIYIWIDGRVRVTSRQFVSNYISLLQDCDIITTSHKRKNVYEEFEYMIRNSHIEWLKNRYQKTDIETQLFFMSRKNMPESYPLFSAGIFARHNNEKLNSFCDKWWDDILKFNNYDQVFYSYEMWIAELKYKTINYHNKFFKVENQHKSVRN